MSGAGDRFEEEVVRETWEIFQVSVEGGEGLEISVLPSSVPSQGTSKAMFLVTNRYRRKVLGLEAAVQPLGLAPGVRPGPVKFRNTSLQPGEVTFGTVEIATDGAVPGEHDFGLSVTYRLGPAAPVRSAGEVPAPAPEPDLPAVRLGGPLADFTKPGGFH